MAAKFTPGPWEADEGDIYQVGTDLHIASLYDANQSGDVLLMAAAPDLYAVVKELLDYEGSTYPVDEGVFAAAKAALAKAEGK